MDKKGLATKTMKHARGLMHAVFQQAFDEGAISVNPVYKINITTKQPRSKKPFYPEEIAKLMEAIKNSRWRFAIPFLMYSGIRRGELLGLKWQNIDVDSNKLFINESVNKKGEIGSVKNKKEKWIQLTPLAVDMLEQQKLMLERERFRITSEYIFPSIKNTIMPGDSFLKMFKKYCSNAGISGSPHVMRHTFVYVTRNVLSLKELQIALDHSSSTLTLELYGNIIEQKEETTFSINEAFKKLKEVKSTGEIVDINNAKI